MTCVENSNKSEASFLKEKLGLGKRAADFHVCGSEGNVITLRSQFKVESEIHEFLNFMNDNCHVTWRVLRTAPSYMSTGTKNIFYTEYRCQSSDLAVRSSTSKAHKKHTNCKATMKIRIKRTGHRCRSTDWHLPKYPTIIEFINDHNHNLNVADNLKFKDVSLETREKFVKLFENGHSPFSALDLHKEDLLSQYGAEQYFQYAADCSLCPDLQWNYRLYSSIRFTEYGSDATEDNILLREKLPKLVEHHPDSIQFEVCADGKPVVAIVTPFMRRVHEFWPYSSELAFIDSTGNFDRMQHRVFVLLTHSFTGALPLGIVITTTENADAIQCGLDLVKDVTGSIAFFNNASRGPKVMLTDNSAAERKALKNSFPEALLLLCIFHVLQAVRRHIWKGENSILKNDKNIIFQLFRNLVYAETEDDLNEKFRIMNADKTLQKYPSTSKYLNDYWAIREDWALCYRSELMIRGNNTNNYAESTMRILKEKIFHRKKAFNIIQLIDFIVTRLDNYYERKLLDLAIGKDVFLRTRYQLRSKMHNEFQIEAGDEDDSYVVSNVKKGTEYVVNVGLGICTCHVGKNGGPCKHQSAIIQKYRHNTNNFFCENDEQQRLILHKLAVGSTSHVPSMWYSSVTSTTPVVSGQGEELSGSSISHSVETETRDEPHNSDDNSRSHSDTENLEDWKEDDNGLEDRKKSEEVENWLEDFGERIRQLAHNNCSSGFTAVKSFFSRFQRLNTDAALESALHNFGTLKSGRLSKGTISVQSASISRRKSKLGGVHRIVSGRPPKRLNEKSKGDHQYVKLNKIQKKAPHSLTYCVAENLPIGS